MQWGTVNESDSTAAAAVAIDSSKGGRTERGSGRERRARDRGRKEGREGSEETEEQREKVDGSGKKSDCSSRQTQNVTEIKNASLLGGLKL